MRNEMMWLSRCKMLPFPFGRVMMMNHQAESVTGKVYWNGFQAAFICRLSFHFFWHHNNFTTTTQNQFWSGMSSPSEMHRRLNAKYFLKLPIWRDRNLPPVSS
jgi:hypothetical protein